MVQTQSIIYQSLVKAYATSIYLNGTKTFSVIREDYVTLVKQYAAVNFTVGQVDEVLALGRITQLEWEETIAFIVPV